jgi:hypothetical protein
MPTMTLCNQDVEISVLQGAYDKWFVSSDQGQETAIEPAVTVYAGRNASLAQFCSSTEPLLEDIFEFQLLTSQWRAERGSTSSGSEIVLCPSYLSIIGMGPKVVPMILAKLEAERDHPDHWFWALQVLTKANPISEEDEGDFRKMARSWLQWASERYVW